MIHKLYKTTKEGEPVYHMTLDSGDSIEDLLKFLFPDSEIKMIEDCPEAPHYSQYPYYMATIGDVVVAFNQPALGTNLNSLKLRNRILNAESKSITQYKRMLELESFFDKLDVDPYFSFVGKQIRVRINKPINICFYYNGRNFSDFNYYYEEHEAWHESSTDISPKKEIAYWTGIQNKIDESEATLAALLSHWKSNNA